MRPVTQPLRDEHRELLPLLERVRYAADAVVAQADATGTIDEALEFLKGHLLPHASAEEAALYPEVARLMGSEQATRTMEVDHAEVQRLTQELGSLRLQLKQPLSLAQRSELARLLYGLYSLIRVHFEKEEAIYLPILDDGLTPDAAAAMFAKMEHQAAEAKRAT